jgi:hypothetical protein
MENMWLISKQAFGVSLDLSCTAGSTPLIVSENLFIYQKIMFTNDDFPTIIDNYESSKLDGARSNSPAATIKAAAQFNKGEVYTQRSVQMSIIV